MKSKMIKAIIIGIVVIVIGTGSYVGYNKIFKAQEQLMLVQLQRCHPLIIVLYQV
ncbi:hypothetical protein [Clostridium sp.]|uniref:hypothetical protein n=1 Tax=Clostridium sp. TaxID=1506 RepID=UPI001A552FD5|nr:hypothetical protein [Clostridium sp.]MBK5241057.1 hypothetical protein [Clostridium sp.]